MVADEAAGLVKAVAQIGPRLLMLLDFAKVIGQEPSMARTNSQDGPRPRGGEERRPRRCGGGDVAGVEAAAERLAAEETSRPPPGSRCASSPSASPRPSTSRRPRRRSSRAPSAASPTPPWRPAGLGHEHRDRAGARQFGRRDSPGHRAARVLGRRHRRDGRADGALDQGGRGERGGPRRVQRGAARLRNRDELVAERGRRAGSVQRGGDGAGRRDDRGDVEGPRGRLASDARGSATW